MEVYSTPIMWALIIFPFIAAIFTVPYVLIQYHKYGSVPIIRVLIVYSFILYLLSAYFLVILPLPPMEQVANLTTPRMQLILFHFITDFIKNTSLVISDTSTYFIALTEPYFYQVFYNILLLLPFGLYLKYYFNCSFKKTLVLSFLLSLFFEITQLSGLYGIYPRGYRLFDVDDLIINTLGGVIGFLIAFLVLKILPNRKRIDEYAIELGKKITVWKRLVNIIIDWFLILLFQSILYFVLSPFINDFKRTIIYLLSMLIYFLIIPLITKGKTLGKSFLNMRLVRLDNSNPKWYQYIIRYGILYGFFVTLPIYIFYPLSFIYRLQLDQNTTMYLTIGIIVFALLFALFFYLIQFFKMLKGEILFYERISKTKNISTIISKQEQKGNQDPLTEDVS